MAVRLHSEAKKAAVLISGNGSNLQAMIDAQRRGGVAFDVCKVLCDNPNAGGLERARRAGIAVAVVARKTFADRDAFEAALIAQLAPAAPDLVVLAGFMCVLGPLFVTHYAGRLLNIHPSLLPKYRGLDTYERALAKGENWHGSSVHFVTEELDGGPLIAQTRVAIAADDDAGSLAAKVLAREHRLYPQVMDWFCRGDLELDGDTVIYRGRALNEPLLMEAPARSANA